MSRVDNFIGLDRRVGTRITNVDHLRQSVEDILTTRVGTRAERREYGSGVPYYIDQPMNDINCTLLYGATATALMQWEPRLRIARCELLSSSTGMAGKHFLEITGEVEGGDVKLEVPL